MPTVMSGRILIVEDDEAMREGLGLHLEGRGHSVRAVGDGEGALSLLEQLRPDVLLLDLVLPGDLDGLDVLRRARQALPEVGAILMTGYPSPESSADAARLGVRSYLVKPFDTRVLDQALESLGFRGTPAPPPAGRGERRSSGAPAPAVPAGGLRILVVDDEPILTQLLQSFLEINGHRVVAAQGGAAALEILARQPFDLILTDLGMPGVNGWTVAEGARRLQPGIPVVLISGWGSEIEEEERVRSGVAAVLQKPYSFDALQHLLVQVLGWPASPRG
jgi:CheY-like chemotaxis protein